MIIELNNVEIIIDIDNGLFRRVSWVERGRLELRIGLLNSGCEIMEKLVMGGKKSNIIELSLEDGRINIIVVLK